MEEYLLFRKQRLRPAVPVCAAGDLFLSAYNSSPRVQGVYAAADSGDRFWAMLAEYGYTQAEYPTGTIVECNGETEAEAINHLFDQLPALHQRQVVIDVTGFLNNYVMALLPLLSRRGVRTARFLYGEPGRYLRAERTAFSDEVVVEVRQVAGFEGTHGVDTSHDLLVLGMGYDWRLAAEVAVKKEHARKLQLLGFPSLQPDMYQQSLLCSARVEEEMGPDGSNPNHFRFAPAHDPFVTAGTLSQIVSEHRSKFPNANVYLSPLATKAQALGFAIYYMREAQESATSIIYPVCRQHMKLTSEGIAGIWSFDVELNAIAAV